MGARTLKLNVCKVVQSKNVNGGSVKAEGNLGSAHKQVYESSRVLVLGRPYLVVKRDTIWAREKHNRERCVDSKTSGCGLVSVFPCDLIGQRTTIFTP